MLARSFKTHRSVIKRYYSNKNNYNSPKWFSKYYFYVGLVSSAGFGLFQYYNTVDNDSLPTTATLQTAPYPRQVPGLYLFGLNNGRIPGSDKKEIQLPLRVPFFDGRLIRDIAFGTQSAAAILDSGDLVQWSVSNPEPTITLRGLELKQVSISNGSVYALPKSGSKIAIVSESPKEILSKSKGLFWSEPDVHYISLNLSLGEAVDEISTGTHHGLIKTSLGRVFSFATGSNSSSLPKSMAQYGVAKYPAYAAPPPVNSPMLLTTLKNIDVVKIACGDNHSLLLDRTGIAWAFGDNSYGQLGLEYSPESAFIPIPIPVTMREKRSETGESKLSKLLTLSSSGTTISKNVVQISAGGNTSFFVDCKKTNGEADEYNLWTCGNGVVGQHGTGVFSQYLGYLRLVKRLSGVKAYSEKEGKLKPVPLSFICAGPTHVLAALRSEALIEGSNNTGSDLYVWGGNEHGQLGTGKRSNTALPIQINPLDSQLPLNTVKQRQTAEAGKLVLESPSKSSTLIRNSKGSLVRKDIKSRDKAAVGPYITAIYRSPSP
ncbi:hypothetical protein CANCADRAFT_55890 [Tortispora caseinolytica NRRL Y-17796]|uniref:Uncharacterized protein n=1 Tax=Tortispora caseinolytica NRRL Y-17796 TaxID=767744 RepID=A0A1E4TKA4_9ASCO|nr:hypothetical protein CANCADRAFT_55890 [Tortispora caseinolytica NRRL Y-17796]